VSVLERSAGGHGFIDKLLEAPDSPITPGALAEPSDHLVIGEPSGGFVVHGSSALTRRVVDAGWEVVRLVDPTPVTAHLLVLTPSERQGR
jgi:hypothetical protein